MVRGQGEKKKSGRRQRWFWNDFRCHGMNFDAMRNLQAEQDQMDDSSGWKSAVWLADNWKLVRTRNKCTYQGGSTVRQIEFSKMAEAGSSFHMFTFQCDIGTLSIKRWDLLFLPVNVCGQ